MPHNTLIILSLILTFGLLAPELFRRLKLPWVASLIVVGSVLGPNGLGYVGSNETVEFFGFLGFTFLMLMAGLETDVEALRQGKRKLALMTVFNGLVPFVFGFVATLAFGYGIWAALVVGTVFVSSSVAIVLPVIRSYSFRDESLTSLMATAIVLEDLLSVFLLAVVLQSFSPVTALPLPQYFAALIISVLFLRRILPQLAKRFFSSRYAGDTKHETQLRFVIVLLMVVLLFFSFLGVHPIVAAFLLGLLLAQVTTSTEVLSKLHTIGYGLFVPVFFFIIGMDLDLRVLVSLDRANLFVLCLIGIFLIAKFAGGYFGGRVAGLSVRPSAFFGVVSLPHLTTTLAATYAASNVGLINSTVTSSIIILSVLTTVLSPYLLRLFSKRFGAKPVEDGDGR